MVSHMLSNNYCLIVTVWSLEMHSEYYKLSLFGFLNVGIGTFLWIVSYD
jgi:hypothetical protein